LKFSGFRSTAFSDLLSLFFLPLVLPSLGVFSLAGSFRCVFLLLFLGALYVAWVLLCVVLFSLDFFFHIRRCRRVQFLRKRGDSP
jgi:hypothetical protein